MATKKVKKTKAAPKHQTSLAGEHSLLIIVGGGFIVILLIFMAIGRTSLGSKYMVKQNMSSMTKEVADENTITISDEMVTPASLTVPVGTQVTWINGGNEDHMVTSYNGTFDSAVLKTGERSTYMFTTVGTYTYTVGEMTGSVIVE